MVSREVVEQLIQNKTHSLAEQLVEMSGDIEELKRRINQMIRFGTVVATNESKTRIKVRHGKNETKFIKWFTLASGEMNQYRCPSHGELALLLDISSGVSSNYLALCGWEGEKFPFPIKNDKQAITQFGPLAFLWDSKAETITIKAPKKIILDTELVEGTGDVKDQVRTMRKDRNIYNGHKHSSPESGAPTSTPQQEQ
jgi:phage baseplate assembly protein V